MVGIFVVMNNDDGLTAGPAGVELVDCPGGASERQASLDGGDNGTGREMPRQSPDERVMLFADNGGQTLAHEP
ncbi:MAG: hypothetical protein ACI8Y4_005196 [Candidatus Poriferisodalaceae bacterium]|jgi:hypothetical protein